MVTPFFWIFWMTDGAMMNSSLTIFRGIPRANDVLNDP
jgi:hypothetical protein